MNILSSILLVILFLFRSCNPLVVNESGIEGTVLRGPICPVVTDKDPCPDAPFRALFHVLDEVGTEVTTFRSDDQGFFRVLLGPGEYSIVADESAPLFPKRQSQMVTVESNTFTDVTLLFDTGIR